MSPTLKKILAGNDRAMLGFLEAQFNLNYAELCETAAFLTPRELEVLETMATGLKNREIAKKFKISGKTLDIHRANIMKKLGSKGANDLGRKMWFFKLAKSLYPEVLEAACAVRR